jgi:hypothetical protein
MAGRGDGEEAVATCELFPVGSWGNASHANARLLEPGAAGPSLFARGVTAKPPP